MSKKGKLCLWSGIAISLIIGPMLFFSQNQKPLSSQKDAFDKTQYLFPKQEEINVSFDLNFSEGVFVKSTGPPFLISNKVLASFSETEETAPTPGVLYLVKQGDCLSEIAKNYKAEIKKIISSNQLADENDIFAGDFLFIPDGQIPLKTSMKTFSKEIPEIPLAESYFIFPTQGEISQGPHGILKNAVDIANKCGTPIVAAASGIVQRTGKSWPEGNKITILHSNGAVSYYIHLSSILVQPKQQVATGDIIGYMGNTGYTEGVTGCHLHFEIRGAKNFLTKYPLKSHLKWGDK